LSKCSISWYASALSEINILWVRLLFAVGSSWRVISLESLSSDYWSDYCTLWSVCRSRLHVTPLTSIAFSDEDPLRSSPIPVSVSPSLIHSGESWLDINELMLHRRKFWKHW
jgi:hypothetical protein